MRSLFLLPALAAIVAAFGSVGCSTRNEDLNRVVNPYWSKAYFNSEDEWYLRSTVVDAPPEHGWISIADGDWLMLEKLKWEITENRLIGWRTYSAAPGSENEDLPGADGLYRGQPVAIFAVTDHFDVRREFNSLSGEQANVISENRDRLWYDREFMRVDWSANLVPTYKFHINLDTPYGFDFGGANNVAHLYGSNDPANPKRWRFESDENGRPEYFEVTTRTEVQPDIAGVIGYYGVAFSYDFSSALIDVRHSFMRVPKSDYQPLPMPPTVVLEDENGKEVRDENGFAKRVQINDRFAYFGSLGRNTFDDNRGMVTSGQIFNAARFNLWKKTQNADGSIIALEDREAQPEAVTYYTNVEHPKQLMDATNRVGAQWNKAFRDTVYNINKAKYTGALDADGIPADVPVMFVVKENDCNVANVERVVAGLEDEFPDVADQVKAAAKRTTVNDEVVPFDGTVAAVRARYDAANESIDNMQGNGLGPNGESFTELQARETQALNDLERICTALEYFTADDISMGRKAPEGIKAFRYQRLGDTRYSMLNLIVGDFQSGWLGLGPPYADPITGETISATANVAVGLLDRSAARAAQVVQAMNGESTELDVLFGLDLEQYNDKKLLENSKLTTRRASQASRDRVAEAFDARAGRSELMQEVAPGRAERKFAKVAGTDIEQKLVTTDDVALFGGIDPAQAASVGLTESILNSASMVRNPALRSLGNEREQRAIRMGQRAMDPPEMIDSLLIGQAIAYKDMSYAERFKKLRQDIYVAVQLHEVGHNTGLFHNFAGSTDAINYGPSFWEIQDLPTDLDDALTALSGRGDQRSLDRVAQLENCLDVIARATDGGADGNPDFPAGLGDGISDFEALNLSTQECLRQSEGMYSSIMDYHGNWNADFNGLGPYDFAANKFAYGQLLEVFPEANLAADTQPGAIKESIFYNDWRDIPDLMVGASRAEQIAKLNQREYVKMDWNTSSTTFAPLPNEVPYRFGYGAFPEPQVRVFDFGPDTRTNASFQLTRYYEHYYFTHFARNRLWDFDAVNGGVGGDAGIMDDFTQKMQWFFFYKSTDPKFAGTYAEEDFLATSIIGLNHMAHILAEPSSGDFSTLPANQLFGITNLRPDGRTTNPLNVAIPWSSIGACTTLLVNDTTDIGTTMAAEKAGFNAGNVPLGEGRPFFLGFTDDYVDFYIRYVGHYWTKQAALIQLADNRAWFPRVDGSNDFRQFDVGWYRVFPEEVTQIFGNLVTQNDIALGGFMDDDGNYIRPDLIDLEGTNPDTSTMTTVLPQIAFNLNYYAYLLGNIFLDSPYDDQVNLGKSMRIVVDGGQDDLSAFDIAAQADLDAGCTLSDDLAEPFDQYDDLTNPPACKSVLSFTHPRTGMTFSSLKVGSFPMGFELIKRMNLLKERFERLDVCTQQLQDGDAITDGYCACISNVGYTRDPQDDSLVTNCTEEFAQVMPGEVAAVRKHPSLGGPANLSVACSEQDLINRRDGARESLDELTDYVNDLRTINHIVTEF